MRAVVQRVTEARVRVAGEIVGEIQNGFLILLGAATDDTEDDAVQMAAKIFGLRVFEDGEGKMNLALADVQGAALVVSQFTLFGDCRKGRRPSFIGAAQPEVAERLYERFVSELRKLGTQVETGRFRTQMAVELVNDGPVTLLLDSKKLF